MKYRISKHRFIIIAFLAALLPRLIFLFWTYPLNNTGDEVFMLMTPARLMGLDWSGVMESYRYYGFGLTVFFAPLLRMIEDPVILYRIMVAVMAVVQALTAPVCFYIMKRFFRDAEESFVCLASVACSYFVTLRAVYIYNESMFILLNWIVVLLLLCLNENVDRKKEKRILTVFLILALIYSMTIHSRAVTSWIAVAVLVVFYLWTYRKWLVSPVIAVVTGAAGYLFSTRMIDFMAVLTLGAESGEAIDNTSVSFSISAVFESLKSLTGWIYIVVGQINTMFVMLGGFALFSALIGSGLIWKALVKRKEAAQEGHSGNSSAYTVIAIFSLAAVAITILGQSFSWLGGVTAAIESGDNNDSMRALTYIRYYAVYFGPVLMLGLLYLRQYKESFTKMFPYVIGGMILLEGFWTFCILPYVADYSGTFWEYAPFSGVDGWNEAIRFRAYVPGIIAAFLLTFVCYVLSRRNKIRLLTGVLCLVLFYEYAYGAVVTDGERGRLNYQYADDIYEILHPLDEQGALPYEIYVQKSATADTHHSTNLLYQYMLKDHKIMPGLPPAELEEAVFLTSYYMEYPELVAEGYLCAQLDNGEYIHVKGERLQEMIEEQGISLKPYMDYETNVPLDQFVSDIDTESGGRLALESSGTEGDFIYGYKVPFSGGEVSVTFELELLEAYYDEVGTVELWRDGREVCIYSQTIERSDFAEDGSLLLEIALSCNATQGLEPVITLNDGSRLRLTGCTFKRISNQYEVGAESEENVRKMVDAVKELDSEAGIVYLHPYKNCDISIEGLKSLCQEQQVSLSIYGEDWEGTTTEQILVIPNDEIFVFSLITDYTIVSKTGGYVILVPKESDLEKKASEKGMILSTEYGISKSYFENREKDGLVSDNASFTLTAGGYGITAVVEVEENVSEGRFRIVKGEEVVTEAQFFPDEETGGRLVSYLELNSYENFYGLQCEIFLPEDVEAEDMQIYIVKY